MGEGIKGISKGRFLIYFASVQEESTVISIASTILIAWSYCLANFHWTVLSPSKNILVEVDFRSNELNI